MNSGDPEMGVADFGWLFPGVCLWLSLWLWGVPEGPAESDVPEGPDGSDGPDGPEGLDESDGRPFHPWAYAIRYTLSKGLSDHSHPFSPPSETPFN